MWQGEFVPFGFFLELLLTQSIVLILCWRIQWVRLVSTSLGVFGLAMFSHIWPAAVHGINRGLVEDLPTSSTTLCRASVCVSSVEVHEVLSLAMQLD
eukprot:SAG11_NODE_13379_length_658_cov_0.611807_2_plen_97_part_00